MDKYEYRIRAEEINSLIAQGEYAQAVKIADILDLIIKISGADIKPVVDKEKLRPVDVPIIEPDVSKIYKATGWRPQIKLEQTIADTLDYFRENEELLK